MKTTSQIPKVTLIGLGQQGRRHLQILTTLETEKQLEVVGIADIVQTDFTLKYAFFTNYHELLLKTQPDIVLIATPNFLHYQHTFAALKQGAHVLKEKPLALTYREGKKAGGSGSGKSEVNYYLSTTTILVFMANSSGTN